MISAESAMNDLGVDAITGVELMDWLGLSVMDLGDPKRFGRLHEVIGYFKQFPKDTQRYLIRRATTGKNVDKLNHVWEYSQLLQKKSQVDLLMADVLKEKEVLGDNQDLGIRIQMAAKEAGVKSEINAIAAEIAIYE